MNNRAAVGAHTPIHAIAAAEAQFGGSPGSLRITGSAHLD
jgi:hypothetical protein